MIRFVIVIHFVLIAVQFCVIWSISAVNHTYSCYTVVSNNKNCCGFSSSYLQHLQQVKPNTVLYMQWTAMPYKSYSWLKKTVILHASGKQNTEGYFELWGETTCSFYKTRNNQIILSSTLRQFIKHSHAEVALVHCCVIPVVVLLFPDESEAWLLTGVVRVVALHFGLFFFLGGRGHGSKDPVDVLILALGFWRRKGRGLASRGVQRACPADSRGRCGGKTPREAGEIIRDLFDRLNGAGADIDSHMLLYTYSHLLAFAECHACDPLPYNPSPPRKPKESHQENLFLALLLGLPPQRNDEVDYMENTTLKTLCALNMLPACLPAFSTSCSEQLLSLSLLQRGSVYGCVYEREGETGIGIWEETERHIIA